jgi:hypothetical protein
MNDADFISALLITLHTGGPVPTAALPFMIQASGIDHQLAVLGLAKAEIGGMIVPVDANGAPCHPALSVNIVLGAHGKNMLAKAEAAEAEDNPYDAAGDEFLKGWDATDADKN